LLTSTTMWASSVPSRKDSVLIELEDLNLEGRDDIFLKLGLARALLMGHEDPFSEFAYLEHLACWNNFFEEEPQKSGPEDFMAGFKSMADDFISGKFLSLQDSIPVNKNYQPQNGAHRISLLLAAKQLGMTTSPASFQVLSRPDRSWNFDFFRRRGLSPASIRWGLLEKSRAGRLTTLIVWPRALGYLSEIESVLDSEGLSSRMSFDLVLDRQQILGLVAHAYWGEAWAKGYGGLRSKAVEAGFEGGIRVTFLPSLGASAARDLKERMRSKWDGEFQGVHTSDGPEDCHRLVTLTTDEDSLRFLRFISWSYVFGKFSQLLETARLNLGERKRMLFAFSGSLIIALAGGREPADTDFLIADSDDDILGWSNHRSYLRRLGLDGDEIVLNPAKHVWFLGYRFIHPRVYDYICSVRRERKDFASTALRKAIVASLDGDHGRVNPNFPFPLKIKTVSSRPKWLGWKIVALGFRVRNSSRLMRKKLRKNLLKIRRILGRLLHR